MPSPRRCMSRCAPRSTRPRAMTHAARCSLRGPGGRAAPRGLALTAEPLAAETAAAWGLIWKAVDDDRLVTDAEALCAQFAAGPRLGLALIKQALDAAGQNDLDAQLDLERDLQRKAGHNPD